MNVIFFSALLNIKINKGIFVYKLYRYTVCYAIKCIYTCVYVVNLK